MTGPAGFEGGTEEVRLQDLERKGISRVRVLRPSDIERMIQGVLAEALVASTQAGEELVRSTRDALIRRMKEAQAQIVAADRAEAEIDRRRAANAKMTAELADVKERLSRAQAALREADAEGAGLEAEEQELSSALSGKDEKAEAKLARERARYERENARATSRLESATASLERGAGLAGKLAQVLEETTSAERRRDALEHELRSLGGAA